MGQLEDSDQEEFEKIRVQERDDKWDCESILSTYSTLYNHPKLISEKNNKIQLSSKTGIPKGVLGRGLTAGALKQLDVETGVLDEEVMSIKSRISEMSFRPKHETLEERRERREEKKANTSAFKSEKMRQEKVLINNKNNV